MDPSTSSRITTTTRPRGHSSASTTNPPLSLHPPLSASVQTKNPAILSPPPPPQSPSPQDTSSSNQTNYNSHASNQQPVKSESDRVLLSLYTYTPSPNQPTSTHSHAHAHGTIGTAGSTSTHNPHSHPHPGLAASSIQNKVLVAHAALPWPVQVGDYVEIRAVRPVGEIEAPGDRNWRGIDGGTGDRDGAKRSGGSGSGGGGVGDGGRGGVKGGPPGKAAGKGKVEAEALEGVRKARRQGYIFRVGEDVPSVPHGQIQVPNSIAQAFKLQHRLDVEVVRIKKPETANIDFIELEFSQYVGRADMWRLGMLLESCTVHVGEKVSLAGGAVRADVRGIYRGRHRYSSGIVTAKTKTIYRSKSAQTYLFIQLCQETWEFDEDGERYYEKVLHGFLPELFARWTATGASHLVTIILFARVYYDSEEVSYLEKFDLTAGLSKDYRGRWCKDFFRVIVDFERKSDWRSSLGEIKRHLERSEREILMDFHLDKLMGGEHSDAQKRIVGKWSFAYEGNVLETINLALNPFDEHYIDRDLSRTGLSMTIITPGTGHFAVDKNLLRLTTERMIDHGIGLDLVCLTKMPLHSVPLFSYVSDRPKRGLRGEMGADGKLKPTTPDPLYFDADMVNVQDRELADCYSLPFWVYCSFYSKTHDKPFRKDRFIPRCKMYEIQMLGILDHNLTTVIVPLLDIEDGTTTLTTSSSPSAKGSGASSTRPLKVMSAEGRKAARIHFDAVTFGGKLSSEMYLGRGIGSACDLSLVSPAASGRRDSLSHSGPTSFQSARLLAQKMEEEEHQGRGDSGGKLERLHPSSGRSIHVPSGRGSQNREDTSPSASSRYRLGRMVTGPATDSLEEVEGMTRIRSSRASILDQPIIARDDSTSSSVRVAPTKQSRVNTKSAIQTTSSPAASGAEPHVRPNSPSALSVLSNDQVTSGASTPRTTGTSASAKRLKSQPSRGSIVSRLFSALGGRSQPSFPMAAAETVSRTDVSGVVGSRGSVVSPKTGRGGGRTDGSVDLTNPSPRTTMETVPKAMIAPGGLMNSPATPVGTKPKHVTQPLPIGVNAAGTRIGKSSGSGGGEAGAGTGGKMETTGTTGTAGITRSGGAGVGVKTGGTVSAIGGGGSTLRLYPEEGDQLSKSLSKSIPRSFHDSTRLGRSTDDSYRNKLNAAYGRATRHATINPCNPSLNRNILGEVWGTASGSTSGGGIGHGRRWQHVRPTTTTNISTQHVVKWRSLCAPACLPLTTDFFPTPEEIKQFYEVNYYDIACFSDQVSFLVRPDAAQANLPLAVMREMASQRLSQNFQFIVLPHSTTTEKKDGTEDFTTLKVLLPGDSTSVGLRVGGASEVLKDASGAIYLSWSNHIHRLSFDPMKQSVTVQRFVRKTKHSTKSHAYKCLVWPAHTKGYQETSTLFKYPNILARLNFNYLDRLIAGEVEDLTSNLRYWRTRYLLIPSGRDPLSVTGVVPNGEKFNQSEILITGAIKILELLSRWQWKRPGGDGVLGGNSGTKPLKLLATTFDPSACVLDEGLMTELERMTSGKEVVERGKTIEGLTLQAVADMMNKPNNGLIIRDRWWNFHVHEDSFTGEQFCSWLMATFTDIESRDQALDWGKSLFEKGLIEHVTGVHTFHDNYFFYRLRAQYDEHNSGKQAKKTSGKSWFGGKGGQTPRDVITQSSITQSSAAGSSSSTVVGSPDQVQLSSSTITNNNTNSSFNNNNNAVAPPTPVAVVKPTFKLTEKPTRPQLPKKRKVKMSQQIIIDLDPSRKSDRAEVAILHADIIHNARNAFHFELNWLGVTAALLDELRGKCSALAERYGLRFVEAPVEQIKDISNKCPYRTAIPIRLALAPPVIPDLHLRIGETDNSVNNDKEKEKDTTSINNDASNINVSNDFHSTFNSVHSNHYFEYAILCQKFGFVLDVESSDRYPDSIEVEYSYRNKQKFEYSQFIHKSGLALVQCLGKEDGFLWADNRLFISAPARGREREMGMGMGKSGGTGGGGGAGTGGTSFLGDVGISGTTSGMSKLEQAAELRARFESFCSDPIALQQFYDEVMPPPRHSSTVVGEGGLEEIEEKEKDKVKEKEKTPEKVIEKALDGDDDVHEENDRDDGCKESSTTVVAGVTGVANAIAAAMGTTTATSLGIGFGVESGTGQMGMIEIEKEKKSDKKDEDGIVGL